MWSFRATGSFQGHPDLKKPLGYQARGIDLLWCLEHESSLTSFGYTGETSLWCSDFRWYRCPCCFSVDLFLGKKDLFGYLVIWVFPSSACSQLKLDMAKAYIFSVEHDNRIYIFELMLEEAVRYLQQTKMRRQNLQVLSWQVLLNCDAQAKFLLRLPWQHDDLQNLSFLHHSHIYPSYPNCQRKLSLGCGTRRAKKPTKTQ